MYDLYGYTDLFWNVFSCLGPHCSMRVRDQILAVSTLISPSSPSFFSHPASSRLWCSLDSRSPAISTIYTSRRLSSFQLFPFVRMEEEQKTQSL